MEETLSTHNTPDNANIVLCDVVFPKRNTRFRLSDFFQIDVDDFHSGNFLFLSAKKVKTNTDSDLMNDIHSCDEFGWVISTYCYDYKMFYKIFICEYLQMAWKNHYHIEVSLSALNKCDGYSANNTIHDFVEWMDFYNIT